MTSFLRKASNLAQQPAFVLFWIAPIWVMVGLASLAIKLLDLRHLAPVLGRNLGAIALVPLIKPAQERRAVQIKRAISIAVKYAPFRSDCYPQAIVAQIMCRLYRLPSTAHFGLCLSQEDDKPRELLAHAWVVCGPVGISGGHVSFLEFTVIGCFAGPQVWVLSA